jgi:hypothetical protein
MSTLLFPWKKSNSDAHVETIKWSHGNSKYEIYVPILEDLELKRLLPHCLDVKTKVEQVVQTNAHLGPSLFRVFPRTISSVLRTIWDIIIADENPQENIAGFEDCICSFIALHLTAEDRHELVLQLRSPHKPREILVQSFYYRLREVNGYVEWLPGNEPQLNENQLQQALFDAMPSTWRDRFTQAGHSHGAMTLAQVLRYFRQQENLAIRKQVENDKLQRTKRPATRDNQTRDIKQKNPYHKEQRGSRGPIITSAKKPFANKRKTLDTDPCPIHDAPHRWGECRVNLYSEFNQKRLRHDDHNKKDNDSKKPAKSPAQTLQFIRLTMMKTRK